MAWRHRLPDALPVTRDDIVERPSLRPRRRILHRRAKKLGARHVDLVVGGDAAVGVLGGQSVERLPRRFEMVGWLEAERARQSSLLIDLEREQSSGYEVTIDVVC